MPFWLHHLITSFYYFLRYLISPNIVIIDCKLSEIY